ncbi:MAG: hypothetical protein ABIG40_01805 [Parcubacteria group bacterium]
MPKLTHRNRQRERSSLLARLFRFKAKLLVWNRKCLRPFLKTSRGKFVSKGITALIVICAVFLFTNIIINSFPQTPESSLAEISSQVKTQKSEQIDKEPTKETSKSEPETEKSSSKSWLLAPPANAQEIVEMRTQNSKTWLKEVLPDGKAKLTWEGQIGAIHYKKNPDDPNELWKDIIPDIVPSDREDYDYEMVKAGYTVYFKEKFNEGKIVRYEKGGEWLEIAPGDLNWVSNGTLRQAQGKQSISEPRDVIGSPMPDKPNHIYWSNAYGGKLDFEWVTDPTRLTKFLIIESFNHLPLPDQKIFSATDNVYLELNLGFEFSDNVTMKEQKDGMIEFQNKQGETLWYFTPLRYWDSSEPRKEGVAGFVIKDNSLSIQVPYEWLQSAVYPVFIDTDVDVQVGVSGDDGGANSGNSTLNLTDIVDYAGFYAPANYHIFSRWQNVTIEGTIDVSYIQYYADGPFGTPQLKIYGVDEDNPDAPTTYAQFVADPLTDAGVDWDGAWTSGAWNQSPSLNIIFQELVDSYTISNEAVMVQVKNDGGTTNRYNGGRSWNYSGNLYGAKLHIEYTAAAPSYIPRPPGISPSGGGFMMF